jgi:hypothetical protein
MGSHLIDGEFQSDKYPTCPRGKFPISTSDELGQDLLWEYSQRTGDKELGEDLRNAILNKTGNKVPFRVSAIAENARVEVTHLVLLNQHLTPADIYRLLLRSFPPMTEPTKEQATRAQLRTYIQVLESIAEAALKFNGVSGRMLDNLEKARKIVGRI